MKTKYKLTFALLTSALTFNVSSYAIQASLEFDLGPVFGQDGSTSIATDSLGVFVVHTNGSTFSGLSSDDTFLGVTPTVGESFGNTDIIVLDLFSAIDFGAGNIGFSSFFNQYNFGDFGANPGDLLGFYFFDGYTDSTSPISQGTNFGFFRSDDVDPSSGASATWVVPGAGDAENISALSSSFVPGADYDDSDFTSDFTVIPEPSTYAAIFGLGVLGFVVWRRRMSK